MGITFKITADSHADHFDAKTLSVVREIMRDGQSSALVVAPGFQIHEVELPGHLAPVPCALVGPATGLDPVHESQVFYGTRVERPNISRLTRLPATQSRTVTVVVVGVKQIADSGERSRGTVDQKPARYVGTLATAYGGPLAPQEPGDPYLPAEKLADSVAFWGEHALSVDGSPESTRVDSHNFAKFSAPAEKSA